VSPVCHDARPSKSNTLHSAYLVRQLECCFLKRNSTHLIHNCSWWSVSSPWPIAAFWGVWTVSAGILYCLLSLWGLWFVIGHEQLNLLIRGDPSGAWTTVGHSIIYLILLNDTREVISQSGHPFKSYDQKSKCCSYIGRGTLGFVWKSCPASDWHGIRLCNMLHFGVPPYVLAKCIYNSYPVRDQYIRAW